MVARSTVSPARLLTPTQSPSRMPRSSASWGWISMRSSACHSTLAVRRVWAPTLYWERMRPVVRISGIARVHPLVGRHIAGDHEAPLAADEAIDVHDGRAVRMVLVAGPLDAAQGLQPRVAHAVEGRGQAGDLVHDLGRVAVVHGIAQRLGQRHRDLPVRLAGRAAASPCAPGRCAAPRW